MHPPFPAKRFVDARVSRADRYSLGHDKVGGSDYLSIPVANGKIDYEEYYRLDPNEFARFVDDGALAAAFADACRQRQHDHRLILQPGFDRGTAQ